ncbi:hypothetical protein OESDEN_09998 [Oesophagostomum dentatum]|uniref:Uncharacterized protein n=1 Tax=Oesophagostomum dentatum TaxID=61180 RepID=A0A0B1T220_OESDE|nr:hypothetical protein OESDEN_09998 [Oesophagostomum dentatum]
MPGPRRDRTRIWFLEEKFQSLHTELRHNSTKSAKIIVAACCLCNECIETRERPFMEEEAVRQQYSDAADVRKDVRKNATEDEFRAYIVNTYFSR